MRKTFWPYWYRRKTAPCVRPRTERARCHGCFYRRSRVGDSSFPFETLNYPQTTDLHRRQHSRDSNSHRRFDSHERIGPKFDTAANLEGLGISSTLNYRKPRKSRWFLDNLSPKYPARRLEHQCPSYGSSLVEAYRLRRQIFRNLLCPLFQRP